MGYEISGALGIKMAKPNPDVLVFVGDGSYLLQNSDIYSSIMYDKKLIIVVCDNGGHMVINRLQLAKGGREYILNEMNKALDSPRTELGPYTPRVEMMKVKRDNIGEIIGKGGATIKDIIEKSGARIDISDSGNVKIAGTNNESIQAAIELINSIIEEPEVGQVYEGKVVKIMEFGAFVNFFGKRDGLVHISQLSEERVEKVTDVVSEGDIVKVKVIGFDKGKVKLSIKDAEI